MAKKYGGGKMEGKRDGGMPNRGMAMEGVKQGDMSPRVEDYQRPSRSFSQEGFNKTLEYIDRQDRFQDKEASTIEKQAYSGRYS